MWTPAARAELARENLPYASSLTDAEWALIVPLLPEPSRIGRPWRWPLRAILDGIQYVLRTGCAWRDLPLDVAPWSTVHRWFLRLSKAGVFEHLVHTLTLADRERAGREASPTGAILDAQAARSGGVGVKGARGYDPARRVVGRKRYALTDTDGRCSWPPSRRPTCMTARATSLYCAPRAASGHSWPTDCFADQAYQDERIGNATAITVKIVRPDKGQKGFAVQPRRWVIERTFGWIARCRRLARDYEATPSSALAFFVLAAAMILVRRLAQPL